MNLTQFQRYLQWLEIGLLAALFCAGGVFVASQLGLSWWVSYFTIASTGIAFSLLGGAFALYIRDLLDRGFGGTG